MSTDAALFDPFDPESPGDRMTGVEVVRKVYEFEPGVGDSVRIPRRRRPATSPVLKIANKIITGEVDLRAVDFPYLLEFRRCRFERPPDLRQANLGGIEFHTCSLPGIEGRNLTTDNDLRLVGGTVVNGKIDLTDGEINGSFELRGTTLVNRTDYALHADRLQIAGALLAVGIDVEGQLRMPGLTTGGNVNFAGADLNNPSGYSLDGNGLHVGGNLHCVADKESGRRFRSTGRMFLPSAHVESDFSLRGAQLYPPEDDLREDGASPRFFDAKAALVADRIRVGGNLDADRDFDIGENFESTGTLRIVNAKIGGSLRMSWARVDLSGGVEPFEEVMVNVPDGPYPHRALHLDGTRIDGGFDARNAKVAGLVRLVDVAVQGSVVLDGAVFSNRGGDVIEGRRFTTGGNLDARGILVFGSVLLPEANIGANLDLRAGRFVDPGRYRRDGSHKPSVDLRVAQIARDLVCAWAEREKRPFSAQGEIRVRRTEVGRQTNFQGAELRAGPKNTAINAFGLITQDLRLDVGEEPVGKVNLRHARCHTLADNDKFWGASGHIELDDFRYDAFDEPIEPNQKPKITRRLKLLDKALDSRYRPSPYDQFAAMLRSSGNEEHAAVVLIEKQKRRYIALARSHRRLGWGLRLWSFVQRAVVGYGYRPIRALMVLVALLVLGTTWFSLVPEPVESNADDNLVWNPLLYTIDHLVPIVDFGHKNRWHFDGWSQVISAALIALGWILATTVAAGLTRMLRRSSN
jgi:hypothetical protein